jgi:hypothetical protein
MARTNPAAAAVPKLRVQRQGKKWRIVYEDTRGLARFNNGEPVDDGGFEDVWDGPDKTIDGQFECMKKLSAVLEGQTTDDPEAENIGP